MKERIYTLISEEALKDRIKEVAERINRDYEGKTIHIICILRGSIFFTCEIARWLTCPVTFDFMQISSYGNHTKSTGKLEMKKDLEESIEGRDVLVVEDILDSGRTLSMLTSTLLKRKPASLKICTLLDKPSRREYHVDVAYNCFEIEDKFVIGFGLDYAQKYRNLQYIGVVEFVEEDEV